MRLLQKMRASKYALLLMLGILAAASADGEAVVRQISEPNGGNETAVDRSDRAISALVLSTIITSIAVLAGSTISAVASSAALAYNRNFQMQVANYMTYNLVDPRSDTWYGYITNPPVVIHPCYKEGIAGHKKGWTSTGTTGTVSWNIPEHRVTIMVYWSVSYSYHCNRLGLSILSDLGAKGHPRLGKHHYFKFFNSGKGGTVTSSGRIAYTVVRHDFCGGTKWICTINAGVQICGTMGTSGTPKIEIKVAPTNKYEVATKQQCSVKPLHSG